MLACLFEAVAHMDAQLAAGAAELDVEHEVLVATNRIISRAFLELPDELIDPEVICAILVHARVASLALLVHARAALLALLEHAHCITRITCACARCITRITCVLRFLPGYTPKPGARLSSFSCIVRVARPPPYSGAIRTRFQTQVLARDVAFIMGTASRFVCEPWRWLGHLYLPWLTQVHCSVAVCLHARVCMRMRTCACMYVCCKN